MTAHSVSAEDIFKLIDEVYFREYTFLVSRPPIFFGGSKIKINIRGHYCGLAS